VKQKYSRKRGALSNPVPRPWTPVMVKSAGAGVNVGVWGRACRFAGQPFPTGMTTAGQELLAAPVALVGTVAGKPLVWQEAGVRLHRHEPDAAVLSGWLTNADFNVSVTTRIEFDGFLRVDLVVTPHGTNSGTGARDLPALEQLWLEVPLRSDLARLYTYWPVVDTGVVQTGGLANSGALPQGGLMLPFKPVLWLGWEEGGFSWCAESAQGWHPAKSDCAIEVAPRGAQTVLRLRLADAGIPSWRGRREGWAEPVTPLTFTFGFQATPVKPIPPDFHEWRINHCGYSGEALADPARRAVQLDEFKRLGVKTLVIHEAWNPIQNYPAADPENGVKELSAACHKRGLKLLVYFGYEFSTLAPEWSELWKKILVKNQQGGLVGGWDRQPAQRDYIVCYNSEWRERFLAKMRELVAASGIDGVYLDGTAIPWGCANPAHGCGWRAADGSLQPTFPVFAVRELFRGLHDLFDPSGGLVNAHQSCCCCTPVLAFAHSYWDGEQLAGNFQMDLAKFRAEFMGRNFGIPCDLLSPPEALGLSLLHDVRPRPNGGESLRILSRVWEAMTRFGVGRAEWLPYWRNAEFIAVRPADVKASLYLKAGRKSGGGRALLVVSNPCGQQPLAARLALHPAALGFGGGGFKAEDALSGESLKVLAGNGLELTLKPLEFRMIALAGI
jgi:hypothetical protein